MKALIVCKHPENSKEAQACMILKKKNLQVLNSWKNTLTEKELKNIDFVIAIGGDGTILSASHYLKNKPLLAVNSSPKTSEGALATIPLQKLDNKLNQILKNEYKTEKLKRIQVSINNSPLPLLALNEIFIANEKAYLISKYKIKIKNKEEIQKSSGILISTGTGSTAWFKSAGGTPFSPQAKYIRLIIREPYHGRLSKITLKKTIIGENQTLTVIPLVPSLLAVDSIKEYKLKPNDKVTIKISPYPLIRII